jgi:hypothetical protein
MNEDDSIVTLKIISNEQIVHSQIRNLHDILKREIEVKVTLNRDRVGSFLEFEVPEKEIQSLKVRLGYTLLRKNEAGWIPVI